MDALLNGLRAAGEPTRLRLLALCAHGELSVSELVRILGQSQPRVSRHLKLLVEGGLLERFREGALVFYRIAEKTDAAQLARTLVDLIPADDAALARDLARLEMVHEERAAAAARYFERVAESWDELRALYLPQAELERALEEMLGSRPLGELVDIGTGTGSLLRLLADRVERGVGIDLSHEMLNVARSNIERAGLRNVHVRRGDMYALPLDDAAFDLATLHQVLHYAADPRAAIREAARVLRPGGRLVVVDFAPHAEERLRSEHQHLRMGFADEEIRRHVEDAGLLWQPPRQLAGDPLSITIWQASKPAGLH